MFTAICQHTIVKTSTDHLVSQGRFVGRKNCRINLMLPVFIAFVWFDAARLASGIVKRATSGRKVAGSKLIGGKKDDLYR